MKRTKIDISKTLSHLDKKGRARMVDVSGKGKTQRKAVASGQICLNPKVLHLIKSKRIPKGDVLTVAKVAAILAAKRACELIPMCHPLPIEHISIDFTFGKNNIGIRSEVKTTAKTGIEIEALVAVSVAALTIYDMCKSADRSMVISKIRLLKKTGGKSGAYIAR